jgi:hypothetical protein
VLQAYSSYTVFAHTLLYTLFKVWAMQTVHEIKPYLALPSAAESEEFMKRVKGSSSPSSSDAAGSRQPLFGRS